MSNKAYIVIVCTMICVTCLVAAEHDDSGSADDYPVKIPWQVLKKLLDISHRSKGLFQLWKNAFHLTKDVFFKDKYTQTNFTACKGNSSHPLPKQIVCEEADTCLKYSQLVKYYNELVIQLRVAEHLLNNSITREIQKKYRNEVEKKERNIIELLHENILPLLYIPLNTTGDVLNCSITEQIVDQKMITYNYCTSIQAANTILSNTILDLNHILNAVYIVSDKNYSSKASEMNINDQDGTEEWCIMQ